MPGNRTGGIKARDTILKHNPNYYREIGKKGGLVKGTKGGFASMSPEKLREVSAKGGRVKGKK